MYEESGEWRMGVETAGLRAVVADVGVIGIPNLLPPRIPHKLPLMLYASIGCMGGIALINSNMWSVPIGGSGLGTLLNDAPMPSRNTVVRRNLDMLLKNDTKLQGTTSLQSQLCATGEDLCGRQAIL